MTDRVIVYAGSIPLESDVLRTNKFAMMAVAKLAAAMLGTSTVVNGLACVPTGPAGLTVNVNPGEIYSLVNVDSTAYSSVAADTTHSILKQGVLLDTLNLACNPPGTGGQSINYLIQATYQDSDTDNVALPYYNASNPTQAWSGPNNTGTAQSTTRKGVITINAKAGTAATTGSQTTPAADSGYTGLWVVTVANGQTQILAGNIVQATNAPILPADLLHAVQASSLITGTDTGAANACVVNYSYPVTALTDGMVLWFKAKAANTGATTLNVNGLGAQPVVGGNQSALQGGELVANGKAQVVWNATISSFVLLECTGAALQVAPATQSQHAVQMGQTGALQSLTASIGSNALTMALNAPTSLYFRNPTLTNGAPVSAFISSNLSLTVPSGATLGTTSATQARLVWLVAYNSGTPVLCVANLNGAPNLDETTLISPTTISGASNAVGTIYSASAVSANSPFRIVGFCDVTETTAGTWATAPTTVQGSGGLALAAMGSIGYGQSWQSVSGSRTLGTTFVNTTGRPIMVNVATTSSATQSTTQINVNGVLIIGSSNFNSGAPASSVVAIVPPGAAYAASVTAGTGTLIAWVELR